MPLGGLTPIVLKSCGCRNGSSTSSRICALRVFLQRAHPGLSFGKAHHTFTQDLHPRAKHSSNSKFETMKGTLQVYCMWAATTY